MSEPLRVAAAKYDYDYFVRGKEAGVSLYEDYRWLPELTIPMVKAIQLHLGIKPGHTVCDFGCARGYVVKAFRRIGVEAFGMDASEWAIANCDPAVKPFVLLGTSPRFRHYDWMIAKDVLEHVDEAELEALVPELLAAARCGVFVVVPLSPARGAPYVCPDYEKDVTHVVRWDLATWADLFQRHGGSRFTVRTSHAVPGVKENWSEWPQSNGFLSLVR
jgi:hypothetical protein